MKISISSHFDFDTEETKNLLEVMNAVAKGDSAKIAKLQGFAQAFIKAVENSGL